MDLLRFLLLLPVRLVRGLFYGIALILKPLIGNVSWSAPAWMPATGVAVRRRPWHFAGGVLTVLVMAAAGWYGWHWYKNRPVPVEPDKITFQVQAPDQTDYTTRPIAIRPLLVTFSGSAAPIELVGKPVTEGIVMSPVMKGQWSWSSDRILRFVPAEDWPVGMHYEVRFDKVKAFAAKVLMDEDSFTFDAQPFTAAVVNSEFYQDPQNPVAKKTIVQVSFNYPVDTGQFEKR
jgi:hypothetical protein